MALWDVLQSKLVNFDVGGVVAFDSDVTAGSLLLCAIRDGLSEGATPSVSDDVNGAWTLVQSQDLTGDGSTSLLYMFIGSASGTVTVTAGDSPRMAIIEVDAAGDTITLDQKNSATGNSATPSSGSVTTLSASELLFGVGANSNVAEETWTDTGWTIDQQGPGTGLPLMVAHRVVSSTGSYAHAPSLLNSEIWASIIATFQASITTQVLLPMSVSGQLRT